MKNITNPLRNIIRRTRCGDGLSRAVVAEILEITPIMVSKLSGDPTSKSSACPSVKTLILMDKLKTGLSQDYLKYLKIKMDLF